LAQDVLVRRVRAAYEQGPDSALTMLFSARSASDLLSINEFTSRAMLSDVAAVDRVRQGKAAESRIQEALKLRQAALTKQEGKVQSLVDQLQARVDAATAAAHQAGVRVASLQAAAQEVAQAR